jgi:hypothetical protein
VRFERFPLADPVLEAGLLGTNDFVIR